MEQIASAETLIFDFDGTLVDTSTAWQAVDREFFARRGLEYCFEDYFALLEGKTLAEVARTTKDYFKLNDSVQDILAEYDSIYQHQFVTQLQFVCGARAFLGKLQALGKPLGIATSSPVRLIRGFLEQQQCELFGAVASSEDVARSKPAPDVYLACAAALGNPRFQNVVVFEDSLTGITGARASGAFVVGVASFDKRNLDEKKALCDLWINSWEDLL